MKVGTTVQLCLYRFEGLVLLVWGWQRSAEPTRPQTASHIIYEIYN